MMRLNQDYSSYYAPSTATKTLYKEEFAKIQIVASQPAKTQLVQHFRYLLQKFQRFNYMCFVIPSVTSLADQWEIEKEDVLYALKTLGVNGYSVDCKSDIGSVYIFPNRC